MKSNNYCDDDASGEHAFVCVCVLLDTLKIKVSKNAVGLVCARSRTVCV